MIIPLIGLSLGRAMGQIKKLQKEIMNQKTIKLESPSNTLERAQWIVRCHNHIKAGGTVLLNGNTYHANTWSVEPYKYEIVKEPKYLPYNCATRDQIRTSVMVREKNCARWWAISYIDLDSMHTEGLKWEWAEGFKELEYVDGKPFGTLEGG